MTRSVAVALLLAVAAGGARGAAAPAVAAAAALRVRAKPATVVLGRGARASFLVDGAGDEPPAVTASAGRIAAVRALGGGAWEAEWIAPGEAYPQVAIVSALSGARFGWIAVPLVGKGVAVAHAAPGSSIQVRIGDATFGPAETDRSGEARVSVLVPPGVTKAMHGSVELDLAVPPVRHVHLAADRAAAAAHSEQGVTLRIFAVDAKGAPRARAPVELSVSDGRVEGLAEVAPGSWEARWTLAPGRVGPARARAWLRDEAGLEAALELARPPGPPARIEVEPSVRRAVAGADERTLVRIRVTDAAGNPVSVDRPRVQASVGKVEGIEQTAPGCFVAAVTLPARLDGRRRADVSIAVGELSASAAIELAPAAPERLVIAPPAAPFVADGTREARLRVDVLDRFGNEVEDVVPTLSANARAEVGAERDEGGGWILTYRPARVRSDDRHDLVVRAGALDAAATLSVVPPPPRVLVAPKLGFTASTGGLRSAYAAAEAGWPTPWLDGRVRVALEVGTFELDRADTVVAGASAIGLRGESRYVPVLASAAWDGGALGPGRWWAAAGAGAAYVTSTVTVDTFPGVHDVGWAPAAHATGGWGLAVAGGTAFGEARVAWYGDPGLETLRGSVTAFVLSLGYRWAAW